MQVKYTCKRRLSRSTRRARKVASPASCEEGFAIDLELALVTAEYDCVRECCCGCCGDPGESRPKSKRLREVSGERAEAKPTYRCRAAKAFLDAEEFEDVEKLDADFNVVFVGDGIKDGCSS